MKLSRYLKFVGVIGIIDAVLGLIIFISYCIQTKPSFFVFIIPFVAIIIFAPAMGITIYTVGNIVENLNQQTIFTLSSDNEKYSVKQWRSDEIKGIVPSIYNDKPVTSIGIRAFTNCESLVNITIPDSVTSIGKLAFQNCESLTSINIPSSVTSIGDSAFYGCTSLKDVYYTGTEEQWNGISIGAYNGCLTNSTIHYNYKG